MNILIADPDESWSTKLSEFLGKREMTNEVCYSGKECQLRVFKNTFDCLVLDLDISNHSSIQVLKYMKQNRAKMKVIFTVRGEAQFSEAGYSKEDLLRMGAHDVVVKPVEPSAIYFAIKGNHLESWKEMAAGTTVQDEIEVDGVDSEYTKIKADSFQGGQTTVCDVFIKLDSGRYLKILHKGDVFDEARLNKYTQEKKVDFLYIQTKDRGIYINFVNDFTAASILADTGTIDQKVKTTKSVVEKYIEEIYTVGIKPNLVDEGMSICQNMFNMVQKDKNLNNLFRTFADYDEPACAHLFLTSFFSVVISRNLDWNSDRIANFTALAGLLHDIGHLRLPPEIMEKSVDSLTPAEYAIYKKHTLFGVEILQDNPNIPEPVRQIIYQHHERTNGEGFPNGLSATKIYPLAKIVSLADDFSSTLIKNNLAPLPGLKQYLTDRQVVLRFDSTVLRALVVGFSKGAKAS